MTIDQYLTNSARIHPDKEALVCGESKFTYHAINQAMNGFAGFLLTNGIQTGDRVAISLDNGHDAVISLWGSLKAGGTLVLIPPATPPERMEFIIQNCQPRYIIAPALKLNQLIEAERNCKIPPVHILTGTGDIPDSAYFFNDTYREHVVKQSNRFSDEDLAAIVYTSGSTGKPKGVMLTHKNFDVVTEAVGEYLRHTPDDIILNFLPLSITYGLLQLLVTFRTGGKLVLEKGFGYPYELIKTIQKENITGFAGVPTVYSIITHLNLKTESFPSLRYITNAAAAMPHSFVPRLRKIFPNTQIYLMHGLTECLRTTFLPPGEIDTRTTSVGRGMKNVELWIEDQDGNRLSDGEVGELMVSGPNIMRGYWNDPEATAKVLREGNKQGEKILRTGDLFSVDTDGYFHFVGRTDDIIKSRGKKVSPLEVENAIYLLNDVLEVRVIGVPDNLLGMAVKAEVVIVKGSMITTDEIKAHCKKHLEDYQIPQIVEFLQSLPKSAGGKIKRIA